MTIREGLERLKEPYRSQAIENIRDGILAYKYAASCKDALWRAFIWSKTEQGFVYWESVYDNIDDYLEPVYENKELSIDHIKDSLKYLCDNILKKINEPLINIETPKETENMNEIIINGELYRKVVEDIKEVKEVKCFEDLGEIEGEYINAFSQINSVVAVSTENNKNTFPKGLAYPFGVVLPQLLQLRDRVRGDWKPNWKSREWKPAVRFNTSEGLFTGSVYNPSIFSFEKQEQAEKFLENYFELLKIYFEATC